MSQRCAECSAGVVSERVGARAPYPMSVPVSLERLKGATSASDAMRTINRIDGERAADVSISAPLQSLRQSYPLLAPMSMRVSLRYWYGGTTRLTGAGEPRNTWQARSNLEP